ncbi:MAG: TspO/MBR family protein [Patescibacteria group bacterium]
MDNPTYYQQLQRPSWAPPSSVFAPVWSVLYVLIALSFGTVFLKGIQGKLPFIVVLPFMLNILFNVIYTPIQFGLKNNYLATLDIFLVLGTLLWALIAIHPRIAWIAYINIPYLLWVSFATVLQCTVTYLNR